MYTTKAKLIGKTLNLVSKISMSTATKLAWKFFCTPIGGKAKAHQKEFLQSALHKTFDVNGTKLQSYRWGHGDRNVIFLHGWASNSFRWRHYLSYFPADQFSIYAIDASAHGLSMGSIANVLLFKAALGALVNDIGSVESIVGHSVGGMATIFYLSESPEANIHGCVIMAAPGEVEDFITFFSNTLSINAEIQASIREYFRSFVGEDPDYFSAARFAGSIQVPALIIHDLEDKDAPVYYAKKLDSAWPKSKLILTEGLGHHLRDEQVYSLVANHISSKGE
jgi:pimeloyl-ACP methyl ester carboxylesterase